MANGVQKEPPHTACQIDFGQGRQVDMEVGEPDNLWIAAGSGIVTANVWMKSVAERIDLRVRIERSANGLEIVLDRGEQEVPWWPAHSCPRLSLTVDQKTGVASILASSGSGEQVANVMLGGTSVEPSQS